MQELSYNLSPKLKENLQKIGQLRREILLAPLPPKTEMRLRWEAMINRVFWSLSLVDTELTKAQVVKLLTSEKKKLTPEEKEILNYKKALDYIKQEWLVTSKPVTPKTVLQLQEIALQPTMDKSLRNLFRNSEEPLKVMLDYLQTGSESPVIQSGVAQLAVVKIRPFSDGNGRVARLLSLLFLYKYGYDFRGLLVLEEYWRRDLIALRQATESAGKGRGLTLWLEYFTEAMAFQLERAAQTVNNQSFQTDIPSSFWELNERQREILTHLEQPGSTITNRQVQKLFDISQITASRDLAKLVSLGLLFPHGGGRSRYYTKV